MIILIINFIFKSNFILHSLAELVEAPEIVRNMSWVENAWPKEKSEDRLEYIS